MSPMRRAIAERLVAAQQTAALVTTFNEIDMSAAMALRERWREAEAWLVARPVAVQGLAAGALIVASDAAVGQQGVAPFIYFQF